MRRQARGPLPRDVRVLTGIGFILALGFGIVAPAIPLFAQSLGVGTTGVGLAISAVAFFRLTSSLASGALVQRIGGRSVLVAGFVLIAVTTGLAGLATSFPVFLALRSASGIGTALISVASLTLLLRAAPAAQRGRAAATYQGGFLLGGLLGPAAGGVLTDLSPSLPFLLYAGSLLAAGAVSLVLLQPGVPPPAGAADAPAPDAGPHDPAPLRTALRARLYLVALLVNFGVGWFLTGVRLSLVPLYVTEQLGRSAAWAGIALLVGSLTQVAGLRYAGRLTDGWGRRPSLVLGAAGASLCLAVLALPPLTGVFLMALAGYGLAAALLGAVPAALVGDVSPRQHGRVIAVFQMSADLGSICGPLVAGYLADVLSFQAAFAATSVVVAAGAVAALALPRR